jgi:TniQ protein
MQSSLVHAASTGTAYGERLSWQALSVGCRRYAARLAHSVQTCPGPRSRRYHARPPLAPLPGEALDSWLGAYADLLHVTVRDIFRFAGIDCGQAGRGQLSGKPWLHQLAEPELAALSAAAGVPAQTLAGMTLARYHGTGLAARPGIPPAPRWWRQPSGSRYCPRCLAANGGRWMLAWRIPWAFACTSEEIHAGD